MAITFPSNPIDGQTFTSGSVSYVYDSDRGYWLNASTVTSTVTQLTHTSFIADSAQSVYNVNYNPDASVQVTMNGFSLWSDSDFTATNGSSITFTEPLASGDQVEIYFYPPGIVQYNPAARISDTAPTNVKNGVIWFDTTTAKLMVNYDDGNSTQWVEPSYGTVEQVGGGVSTYNNLAAFPSTDNTTGALALDLEKKTLYVWDGSEWDRIYSDAQSGIEWVTQPQNMYMIPPSSTGVIGIEASDPEGFPINYSYVLNDSSSIIDSISSRDSGFGVSMVASPTGGASASIRTIADNGLFKLYKTSSIVSSATSASQLATLGITTNGVYELYLDGYGSSPTECYVNFTLPGGPYILAMVLADNDASYGYDGAVWTNTSGGLTTALDPTSNTNQVSNLFYTLPTTRTALALHENVEAFFHYYSHASYTLRDLSNGAVVPSVSGNVPVPLFQDAGTEVLDGATTLPAGWVNAWNTSSGYTWGTSTSYYYYRYGWQHGVPDPSSYGYARFGFSCDQDTSDSRDRMLGVGVKSNGGGGLGTFSHSAGGGSYNVGNAATKGWLYLKN